MLEMGEPVRIIDLAEKMIHLSGYEVRNNKNPLGDIVIKITGLRPGEKLNEELIIGNNVYSTDHSQILKAQEKSIDWGKIEDETMLIKTACESLNVNDAMNILKKCVEEWRPHIENLSYLKSDINIDIENNSDIAEC